MNLYFSQSSSWKSISWDQDLDTWWHYKEGVIGGPSHWGHTAYMAYTRSQWPICYHGKKQSPINIETDLLVHDQNLKPLEIIGYDSMTYEITNGGQDVHINLAKNSNLYFTNGPLSYDYKVFGLLIKFGSKSEYGSSHKINNHSFSGEIEIYSYNTKIAKNYSNALTQPNGLAVVSAFLSVSENNSHELSRLIGAIEKVKFRGSKTLVDKIPLRSLLPDLSEYITYQGSITYPGCYESVQWIILNRPVPITETQLKSLRSLRMLEFESHSSSMADNRRPVQGLNGRTVMTNIKSSTKNDYCPITPKIRYSSFIPNI